MMAFLDYGKFSNQTKYPYVNWEPRDENNIQAVIDVYLRKSMIQKAGFKISINIDPAQLQVYAGSKSGNAWHIPVPHTNENDANPMIVVLRSFDGRAYYILNVRNTNTGAFYQLFTFSRPFAPLTFLNSEPLVPISFLSMIRSCSASSRVMKSFNWEYNEKIRVQSSAVLEHWILVSDNDGRYILYLFFTDGEQLSLLPIAKGSFKLQSSDVVSFGVAISFFQSGQRLIAFQALQTEQCGLLFQLFEFDPIGNLFVPFGDSQCIERQLNVSSASCDLIEVSSVNSAMFCQDAINGSSERFLIATIVYSKESEIFSAAICISLRSGIKTTTIVSPSSIDIGRDPDVSLIEYQDTVFIMEVHTDGFCWNNEVQNKASNISVCDLLPRTTPFVLNYNFATLTSWVEHHVMSGKFLSPCNSSVLHGAYDQGHHPSLNLFVFLEDFIVNDGTDLEKQQKLPQESLYFLEIHSGISDEVKDLGACGLPLAYRGLVIDSWRLPLDTFSSIANR